MLHIVINTYNVATLAVTMWQLNVDQPMVQMMPVLRAVVGSESMSSRHMCSRKVSAMAALSCWVWMKAEPMSGDFNWGMAITGETGEVLQKKKYWGHSNGNWSLSHICQLARAPLNWFDSYQPHSLTEPPLWMHRSCIYVVQSGARDLWWRVFVTLR